MLAIATYFRQCAFQGSGMRPDQDSTGSGVGVGSGFRTTHWSVILAAGDMASPKNQEALARFCQAYWSPVYFFLRKAGHVPHDAEDLTQSFFAWFLQKNKLAGVAQGKGRFRSFLLTVLKRFLINEWHHQQTARETGGKSFLPIDAAAETCFLNDASGDATPEAAFDREWANRVWDEALRKLREEYARDGKSKEFDCLQTCFPGAHKPFSCAEAAQTLGISENAVRMAVNRLRRRFRELMRREVAAQGTSQEEIDEEIRYLLEILSRK
jgi:RNA polymerase sigma factor (sigma-70 family)